jgi:arsenate reductase
MAEAIVNARLGETWEASSAGTRPAGFVHPAALQALQEIGISHFGRSKHVDEMRGQLFDAVITVCDSAAEACPVWLGQGRRIHHDYPDPAREGGQGEDVLGAFRDVRDRMLVDLPGLLESPKD